MVNRFYFILDYLRNSVIVSLHFIVNVFYYVYYKIKHRLLYKKLLTRILLGNSIFLFLELFIKHIYIRVYLKPFLFFRNTYEEFESGVLKFKFAHISNASIV